MSIWGNFLLDHLAGKAKLIHTVPAHVPLKLSVILKQNQLSFSMSNTYVDQRNGTIKCPGLVCMKAGDCRSLDKSLSSG